MTPRQLRFIDNYIKTGNASQSYVDAGYTASTETTKRASSCQMLAKTNVRMEVLRRMKEIADAGMVRIESKRVLLWEIAQKASGKIKPDDDSQFQPDYKAAIAAINELNRMDGHHSDSKIRIKDDRFTFDAEILPPESENAAFTQLDDSKQNEN
ncbi:terminase small subunit [Bacterioplanoides sp.]|uniref:terminase small subunit n=1 Tax=Bacterioplanoides sp. TaxID=2066072 RepID=UPI003B5B5469